MADGRALTHDPGADFDRALCAEQTRLHGRGLPVTLMLSSLLALLMVGLLWPHASGQALLAWLAAVVLAAGVRLAVHLRRRSAAAATDLPSRQWRSRYRLAMALHGIAWASGGAMLLTLPAGRPLEILALGLAGMSAAVLMLNGFDRVGALLQAGPMALPFAACALWRPADEWPQNLALVLLMIGVAGLSMRRGRRLLREQLEARVELGRRSEELERTARFHDRARAEEHRRLERLMLTSRQGICFLDEEGRCTELNPTLADLLGRDRSALLGQPLAHSVDGPARTALAADLALRSQGRSGEVELSLDRGDGRRRRCLVHGSPLTDADGRFIGSVAIWTDITARWEAEQALRISEVVLNASADMTSVLDEHHVYRMVNAAWLRTTGFTQEQVIGRRSVDLMPTLVRGERELAVETCLRHGHRVTVRSEASFADGRPRVLQSDFFPIRMSVDGPRLVALVTRDVTLEENQRQALESAAEVLRGTLDATGDAIFATDAVDGSEPPRIANDQLFALWPLPQALRLDPTVAGIEAAMLTWAEDPEAEQQRIAAVTAAGMPVEDRIRLLDGRRFVRRFAAVPLHGRLLRVWSFRDISSEVRAQSAVAEALAEAERANNAKSRFLSHMSHELRTPLNSVLGFAQLLSSQPLSEQQRHQLGEILRGGRHLLALINDLLDLGRIEAGVLEVDCRSTDAPAAVADAVATLAPLALERTVTVRTLPVPPDLPAVWADARRLRQVLINLLSNAVKYNRRGGRVDVEMQALDGEVELRVIDEGPGLTPDEQARLFRPFERLQLTDTEGTGIGLAFSRHLVEAMGGRVGVHSVVGQGSTFWLRLAAAGAPAQAAAPEPPQALPPPPMPPARGPFRALYIEDNPVNQMLVAAMLEGELELALASDPLQGIEMALAQPPDLILLDIQLPVMDGFEVLRRLRSDARTRGIPVVAVSANAMAGDLSAGRAAGFDGYVTKPVDMDELLQVVRTTLHRSLHSPPPSA